MSQQYIGKTPYAGFGVFVREVGTDDIIMQNQAIFGGKVFEILGHAETVQELKEMRGDDFSNMIGNKHKIFYFDMRELSYQEGTRGSIKYEILKIIEAEKKA